MFGIDFVKIASVEAAHKYEVTNIPSLVYFRYEFSRNFYVKFLIWILNF